MKANEICIVLDAGHGGSDHHNIGYSKKYYEHKGNLEFALKLTRELKAKGFKVILTRDHDMSMALTQRSRIAIANKAFIFMSIHSNAATPQAHGASIYYSVNRPNDEAIAERLGNAMADAYGVHLKGAFTRESKTRKGLDYYTVIDVATNYKKLSKNATYEVPHVLLIERAFHSNKDEELKLLDENISLKCAKALANEFEDIFVEKPKPQPKPTPKPIPKSEPKRELNFNESISLLQSKFRFDDEYWIKNCVDGGKVNSGYAYTIITKATKTNNIKDAIEVLIDKKNNITSSPDHWLKCTKDSDEDINGAYMRSLIIGMANNLKF